MAVLFSLQLQIDDPSHAFAANIERYDENLQAGRYGPAVKRAVS